MKRNPALGLLIALLVAAPAAADWLVTHAGGRVETKGPWRVKGKLVVFNRTDGTLASLRVSEVDLEASRKATADAQAKAAAPAAPEAPKKKLASLTDADFRKQPPASSTASPAETEEKPAVQSGPVTVSSWRRADDLGGDGVKIEGTLHNNTDDLVVNAGVEVQLFNEAGERVGTAVAVLSSPSLQPKGTVDFRASFPGVFTYAEVKFEPKGLPLDIAPAPAEEPPPAAPPP
ncbi:MAG TPA: FxLYD domain-containing protein [Thermoanaerobaculia bacterium]|jgi:hypothetical protein|nr:FxLYD domain-containing protein [Thermoanaerobaculia bacterium]